MKTLYLSLLILISVPAIAQVQSDCKTPALLQKAYATDIATMAMERLYNLQSPDTGLIEVPQPYTDTILGGLSAIVNTGNMLEADSVFMTYCIHTYNSMYNSNYLELSVDGSQSWTDQWEALNNTTGYGALDSFMTRYGYTIAGYYIISNHHRVYIKTDKAINAAIAADSFKKFTGIYSAKKAASIGDGDYISYKRDTASHFSFMMGWGDCPAGCTFYKTWYYTVTNDCMVSLDSTRQSYLVNGWRYPTNCNLLPISVSKTDIKPTSNIYPNPVKDKLHIETNGYHYFTLTDMAGRKLKEGDIDKKGSIDMSVLNGGIYLLHLKDKAGSIAIRKIVKE